MDPVLPCEIPCFGQTISVFTVKNLHKNHKYLVSILWGEKVSSEKISSIIESISKTLRLWRPKDDIGEANGRGVFLHAWRIYHSDYIDEILISKLKLKSRGEPTGEPEPKRKKTISN